MFEAKLCQSLAGDKAAKNDEWKKAFGVEGLGFGMYLGHLFAPWPIGYDRVDLLKLAYGAKMKEYTKSDPCIGPLFREYC
jgi:hypothetical protein